MADVLGVVASGRRYPVKSMMGEEPNVLDFGNHGVVGDRAYAFVDVQTGALVSAKNPKNGLTFFCQCPVFELAQGGRCSSGSADHFS